VNRDESLLTVFGQKCMRIVKITTLDNQTRIDVITDIISFPDLILDAHWMHDKTSQVAIATAHNAVWCVDCQTSKSWLVAQCEENSILCLYEYFWRQKMDSKETKHPENDVSTEQVFTEEKDHENSWKLLLQDSDYSSYSLMSVSHDRKLVAFGNLKGNVKVHDTGIVSLYHDTGIVSLYHDTGFYSQSIEVKPFTSKVLSFSGPTTRLEVLLSADDHVESCHVVFGDRKGSVHLYDAQGATKDKVLHPIHTLPVLHGAIGVTQLCTYDGKLYSAGRDGTYRQYKLCHSKLELIDTKKVTSTLKLLVQTGFIELLNEFQVFKGLEWVEKLIFTTNGDIVVIGFHTAFFIVWNLVRNEALFKVKCGGGHRAWDFSLHQLPESSCFEAVFTYLKGNSVNTHKTQIKNSITKPVLKSSFHGRETTCMAYVCDCQLGNQGDYFLYSLVIFVFDEKECKFFILAQSQYLLRCVLSVQHVVHKDSSGRHAVMLLAGDTAGKITIWDVTHHLFEYVREEAGAIDTEGSNGVTMETSLTHSPVAMETVDIETEVPRDASSPDHNGDHQRTEKDRDAGESDKETINLDHVIFVDVPDVQAIESWRNG
ncbi:hypothetical protein QZH41_012560, partial [Actinostola sp. cb2023]